MAFAPQRSAVVLWLCDLVGSDLVGSASDRFGPLDLSAVALIIALSSPRLPKLVCSSADDFALSEAFQACLIMTSAPQRSAVVLRLGDQDFFAAASERWSALQWILMMTLAFKRAPKLLLKPPSFCGCAVMTFWPPRLGARLPRF